MSIPISAYLHRNNSKRRFDARCEASFSTQVYTIYNSFMRIIHEDLNASFRPRQARDFGSGVGRLVIPLTRVCESVTGVAL